MNYERIMGAYKSHLFESGSDSYGFSISRVDKCGRRRDIPNACCGYFEMKICFCRNSC